MSFMKQVWFFGDGNADGDGTNGSASRVRDPHPSELSRLGVPVPAGFVIGSAVAEAYRSGSGKSRELDQIVLTQLRKVEGVMGRKFGDSERPLLLSVRSGPETAVCNIGLTEKVLGGLIAVSGDAGFAYIEYLSLIASYGEVVLGNAAGRGLDDGTGFRAQLNRVLEARVGSRGEESEAELTARDFNELCKESKALFLSIFGKQFPDDEMEQLQGAIGALSCIESRERVIDGANSDSEATVTVQARVFGNVGTNSGVGKACTRDESTGADELVGEFLLNGHREDLRFGSRATVPLRMSCDVPVERAEGVESLEELFPAVISDLEKFGGMLERYLRHPVELDFALEEGRLFVLEAHPMWRRFRPKAAVRIAVSMVREGLIDPETAVFRIDRDDVDLLLAPELEKKGVAPICRGIPACPGIVTGRPAFSGRDAKARAQRGESVVFVGREWSRPDGMGLGYIAGVLTALGGMTSHAAIFARSEGIPAVVGVHDLDVVAPRGVARIGRTTITEDDTITLDGTTGEVFLGALPRVVPEPDADLTEFLEWERRFRPRDRFPTPYSGHEPFAFVSYCHADLGILVDDITAFKQQGRRLWYDDGIEPSHHWAGEITARLDQCSIVLCFVSSASIHSKFVRKELHYALDKGKPCLPIVLDDCQVPSEIRFLLADVQFLYRNQLPRQHYLVRLNRKLIELSV